MTIDPFDINIGKKLRQLRNLKGISQASLAADAGITFQQVQKYEKGVNRISASRLYSFSKILGVPVTQFYQEAEKPTVSDLMESKETIVLVREYQKITSPAARKHVLEIIKSIGDK